VGVAVGPRDSASRPRSRRAGRVPAPASETPVRTGHSARPPGHAPRRPNRPTRKPKRPRVSARASVTPRRTPFRTGGRPFWGVQMGVRSRRVANREWADPRPWGRQRVPNFPDRGRTRVGLAAGQWSRGQAGLFGTCSICACRGRQLIRACRTRVAAKRRRETESTCAGRQNRYLRLESRRVSSFGGRRGLAATKSQVLAPQRNSSSVPSMTRGRLSIGAASGNCQGCNRVGWTALRLPDGRSRAN
jgi:hypothetical protein